MKHLFIILIKISLLITHGVNSQRQTPSQPVPTESYPNQFVTNDYNTNIYWIHNNTDITFEVHYKKTANKWFLFGLADVNSNYSDVVVGWINDDDMGHFSHRILDNSNKILIRNQDEQNWFLLDAFNKNDYGVLKFYRKIRVCDLSKKAAKYVEIMPGFVNTLVYSFGQNKSDNEGRIDDFRKVEFVMNQNLLKQGNGPFNCEPKRELIKFESTPTSNYANFVDLVDGVFRFYWNFTSTDLIGEIHCKTKGWVGFGLSPNGGMDGSDVIVGWVGSNGLANFTVN